MLVRTYFGKNPSHNRLLLCILNSIGNVLPGGQGGPLQNA